MIGFVDVYILVKNFDGKGDPTKFIHTGSGDHMFRILANCPYDGTVLVSNHGRNVSLVVAPCCA